MRDVKARGSDIDVSGTCPLLQALLLIFVAAAYSNTLKVPFHFDDYPNIVDNPAIRIERLTPDNLLHAALESPLPSPRLSPGEPVDPHGNGSGPLSAPPPSPGVSNRRDGGGGAKKSPAPSLRWIAAAATAVRGGPLSLASRAPAPLPAVAVPLLIARRSPLISFGLLWFLMNLVVESSFLPLDLVFEHRLYLPSIGLVIAGASLVERALVLKPPPLSRVYAVSAGTGMVIMLFTIWTYDRNEVWRDEFTLWSDTVAKSPESTRAHSNLGLTYRRAGYYDQAIDEFKKALARKPDYADFHNNLGVAYEKKRVYDEALREYQTALRLKPNHLDKREDRSSH